MSDESPSQTPEQTNPDTQTDKPSSAQSRNESPKPRVPSALTVENLRKHEEDTEVVDVVQLMIKNTEESVESSKSPLKVNSEGRPTDADNDSAQIENVAQSEENINLIEEEQIENDKKVIPLDGVDFKALGGNVWLQRKNATLAPIATREEVRGFKLSGEEYTAISIDVQTDESYLAEYYGYIIEPNMEEIHSRPVLGIAATDVASFTSERRRRKHITSDISSAEIADDESVLHISKSGESDANKKTDHSSTVESDHEDANIVVEIPESEIVGQYSPDTISSVGPPTILKYKTESDVPRVISEEKETGSPGNALWEGLPDERRDYYSNLIDEMRKMREEKSEIEKDLINIGPGSSNSSRQDARDKGKEREKEKGKLRESKSQLKQAAGNAGASGQMMANQTNFYTFARQLKTVNYSLSSEKCMEEGWTIRPLTPEPPQEAQPEIFVYDPCKDVITGKRIRQTFVQKFHLNGMSFLTVFPDGTGNVWYQSGNVAISIIATDKIGKMTFILHDDVATDDCYNIQGVFEPSGHCACYYPSGRVRLLLSHVGGEFFNTDGDRMKKWQWRDQLTHVHAPPFQPITFSLNRNIGVRVLSQEVIYITFADGSRSIRFNAGTRLRFKPAAFLPKIQQLDPDLVILHEKRLHIQSIVEKLNNNLRFPNSPRLKKLKLPGYLASELERTMKIRQQLQEGEFTQLTGKKSRSKKSVSSKMSSEIPVLPKRQLKRLPFYPKLAENLEFEEIKPVVIVN